MTRIKHLKELIRWTNKAVLIVPSVCLNPKYDPLKSFEDFRNSLKALKEDEGTVVSVKKIDDELAEITIEAKLCKSKK